MFINLTLEEIRRQYGESSPRRQFLFARLQTNVFSRDRENAPQPIVEVIL